MKLKGYFMLIVVILVFFLFYISVIGIKESLTPHLTETQCTQFKTCQDCVATPDSHYGYPCYWNQTKGDCGSFLDEGYSRVCPPQKESFELRSKGNLENLGTLGYRNDNVRQTNNKYSLRPLNRKGPNGGW